MEKLIAFNQLLELNEFREMSTSAEGIVEVATLVRSKAQSTLVTLKVVVDLTDINPVIEDDGTMLESIDGEYKKP